MVDKNRFKTFFKEFLNRTEEKLEEMIQKQGCGEKELCEIERDYFKGIKEIINNNKKDVDKYFILATDIEKLGERVIFKKKDKHGPLDNGFRLHAAELLEEKLKVNKEKTKKAKFFLLGGCNKDVGKFRTEAMRECLKGAGVKEEYLEELRCCPGNTCGNMIEILKTMDELTTKDKDSNFGLITNLYHLPRAMAIGKYLLNKKNHSVGIAISNFEEHLIPIPAEEVIWDQKRKEIKKFYNSESIYKRIKSEISGYCEAKRDRYKCNWPLRLSCRKKQKSKIN